MFSESLLSKETMDNEQQGVELGNVGGDNNDNDNGVRSPNKKLISDSNASSSATDVDDGTMMMNKTDSSSAVHALSKEQNITGFISFLFVLFGLGPSWLLSDAMFIQIPYWQNRQPEGLTLANKMTISGIMPLVTVIPIYFVIVNNIGNDKLSFRKLSYVLIIIQILSSFLISIAWELTINNVSIIIHLVTFTSSFVGHMMLFAIVPWVTSINHKLSAPILTGTNLGTLWYVSHGTYSGILLTVHTIHDIQFCCNRIDTKTW